MIIYQKKGAVYFKKVWRFLIKAKECGRSERFIRHNIHQLTPGFVLCCISDAEAVIHGCYEPTERLLASHWNPFLILKHIQGIYAKASGEILHSFHQLPRVMCVHTCGWIKMFFKKAPNTLHTLCPPVLSSLTLHPSFIKILKLTWFLVAQNSHASSTYCKLIKHIN